VGRVASVSPAKVLPAVARVADEAKRAGANDIAVQAQQILDSNKGGPQATEGQQGLGSAISETSSQLYFITPPILTDGALEELKQRIRQKFSPVEIQPAVHPLRQMDDGVEIVYYKSGEDRKATDLLRIVKNHLTEKQITTVSQI
jgi:hypothetical protein